MDFERIFLVYIGILYSFLFWLLIPRFFFFFFCHESILGVIWYKFYCTWLVKKEQCAQRSNFVNHSHCANHEHLNRKRREILQKRMFIMDWAKAQTHDYRARKYHEENYTLKTRFPKPCTLAFCTKISGFVSSSQWCAFLYTQSVLYCADNLNTALSDSHPLIFSPFCLPIPESS